MLPDQDFPEGLEIQFASGDILILSTDGVWEAHNAAEEAFGKTRFKEIIHQNQSKSANQLVSVIYEEVKKFIGDASLKDDLTIVVIKADNVIPS